MSRAKTASREAFRTELRDIIGGDGARRMHLIAECRDCEREEAIPINTRNPLVPIDMARQLFRKRGWKIGGTRSKDMCPACHGLDKRDSAPAEERADIAIETVIVTLRNALIPAAINENIPEKEPEVAKNPSPNNAPTAIGAALVEAALDKSGLKTSRRGDGERLRQTWANMTPEERTATVQKGHKTRKDRAQAAIDAKRAKRGAGSKAYWASMTKEERSDRQKRAAQTRLARRGGKELTPEEIAAAKVALASSTAQSKVNPETPMPQAAAVQTPEPTVTAAPPRAATPAENRRILEALDVHYSTDRQLYVGDMTDKKIGENLGLPVAWVTALRGSVYGPERNEVQDGASELLRASLEKLSEIETTILTEMDRWDARLKAVRAEVKRVADGVGVKL